MSISFRFISSYLGSASYDVLTSDERFRMSAAIEACDYQRSIYNGSPEQFEREVVAKVGCVTRDHDSSREVPAQVVDAFNAYLSKEHQSALDWARKDPAFQDRFDRELESIIPAPRAFQRAYWDSDARTWVRH